MINSHDPTTIVEEALGRNGTQTDSIGDATKAPTFVDGLLKMLFGQSSDTMSPAQLKERGQKRIEVSANAGSAAQDPGEEYMGIPNAGSGGFDLASLARMFMGGSGGS